LTAPEIPARNDKWLRAVGYGLLAEVATILTIIAIVMVYRYMLARGHTDLEYASFGRSVGEIVGVVGGTIYTFLFARLLMRSVSSQQVAHGIVVAIAAVALSVGGSIAGHQGVPAAYLLASALKIAAGGLAGFMATRSVA